MSFFEPWWNLSSFSISALSVALRAWSLVRSVLTSPIELCGVCVLCGVGRGTYGGRRPLM